MDPGDSVKGRHVSDDPLTHRIIGAAIEVHRLLGPGLLESTYEECLCLELVLLGVSFERQVPLPIVYKSMKLLRSPDIPPFHRSGAVRRLTEQVDPLRGAGVRRPALSILRNAQSPGRCAVESD